MSVVDELSTELRSPLPDAVAALPEANVGDLLDALRSALATQARELDEAVTAALNHVPRPLRGAVRKAVGL